MRCQCSCLQDPLLIKHSLLFLIPKIRVLIFHDSRAFHCDVHKYYYANISMHANNMKKRDRHTHCKKPQEDKKKQQDARCGKDLTPGLQLGFNVCCAFGKAVSCSYIVREGGAEVMPHTSMCLLVLLWREECYMMNSACKGETATGAQGKDMSEKYRLTLSALRWNSPRDALEWALPGREGRSRIPTLCRERDGGKNNDKKKRMGGK